MTQPLKRSLCNLAPWFLSLVLAEADDTLYSPRSSSCVPGQDDCCLTAEEAAGQSESGQVRKRKPKRDGKKEIRQQKDKRQHRAREESPQSLEEWRRAVKLSGLRVSDSSCGQGLRLVLPGASMRTEI